MSDVKAETTANVAAQIDQLKELFGLSTDADLAKELGLGRSTIAQWRRRNAIPFRVNLSLLQPLQSYRKDWPTLSENHRHALIQFVADIVTVEEAMLLLVRLTERGMEYVDFSPSAHLRASDD